MNIGILTIHYGVNHGSALQSFALNRFLNNNGYETKTINYIPKRYKMWNTLYYRKKNDTPFIIIALYFPVYFSKVFKVRKIFSDFLADNLILTKKVTKIKKLNKLSDGFTSIIVGSDQVWNDDYNGVNDNVYFLEGVCDKVRKNAYAASFGKDTITCLERKKIIYENLKSFNKITVREENAISILNEIGIDNVNHVVDPTFLFSKQEWLNYSKNSNFSKYENYILVYVMDGEYKDLLNNAYILSKKEKLPIYVICFDKINDDRITKCFTRINPFDFVTLVANSNYVVTNSFHGTAFSIIMRRKFLVVGKKKYNSRMLSLLKKVDLGYRFIMPGNVVDSDFFDKDLNINEDKLNQWIDSSKDCLIKMCGDESVNNR